MTKPKQKVDLLKMDKKEARLILSEYVLQTLTNKKTGVQALEIMDLSDEAFSRALNMVIGVER